MSFLTGYESEVRPNLAGCVGGRRQMHRSWKLQRIEYHSGCFAEFHFRLIVPKDIVPSEPID